MQIVMMLERVFNVLLVATAFLLVSIWSPALGEQSGSGEEWGSWSGWGSCSKECGGGVRHQFRLCLAGNCTGASTQYKSCNLQPCPPDQSDFRSSQCSIYNNYTGNEDYFISLVGKEAFTDCQLYCISPTTGVQIRTIAKDGTRCTTPSVNDGICIGSICAETGCDHILGSTEKEDECLRCQGDQTEIGHVCKGHSGHLTTTATGQVMIGVVPMEATFVKIIFKDTLVLLTNNEHTSLSENEQDQEIIDLGGAHFKFLGNGTLFSRGPIMHQFIIQVRAEGEKRPSASYYYHLLGESEQNVTDKHDSPSEDFYWQYSSFSECTVTCGAGSQISRPYCTDQQHPDRVMPDSFCRHIPNPLPVVQNCFRGDCPPRWVVEPWSPCSTSCDSGWKQRSVKCKQIQENGFETPYLPSTACAHLIKPEDASRCNEGPCGTHWVTEPWTPCFPECGSGNQERDVACTDSKGNIWDHVLCIDLPRPPSTRPCNSGPCFYSWHTSQWSECSEQCGNGTQSRQVYCATQANREVKAELCLPEVKPVDEKKCKDIQDCQVAWGISAWNKCTGTCGQAETQLQHREVFCKAEVGQQIEIVEDGACNASIKPHDKRPCELTECPAWVAGEWGECSATCDEGIRTRSVSCQISLTGAPSNQCDPVLEPSPIESCFIASCPTTEVCIDILDSAICKTSLTGSSECTNYLEEFCCATCAAL